MKIYILISVVIASTLCNSLIGKFELKRNSNSAVIQNEVDVTLTVIENSGLGSLELTSSKFSEKLTPELEAFSLKLGEPIKHTIDMRYVDCQKIEISTDGTDLKFKTTNKESYEDDTFEINLKTDKPVKEVVESMKTLCGRTHRHIKDIKDEIEYYLRKGLKCTEKQLSVDHMDSFLDRWPFLLAKKELTKLAHEIDDKKDLVESTQKLLQQLCEVSTMKTNSGEANQGQNQVTQIVNGQQFRVTAASSNQEILAVYSEIMNDFAVKKTKLKEMKQKLIQDEIALKDKLMNQNSQDEQLRHLNYQKSILNDRLERAQLDEKKDLTVPVSPADPNLAVEFDNHINSLKGLLPARYDLELEKLSKAFKPIDSKLTMDLLSDLLETVVPKHIQY
jgi:hypothetical protein